MLVLVGVKELPTSLDMLPAPLMGATTYSCKGGRANSRAETALDVMAVVTAAIMVVIVVTAAGIFCMELHEMRLGLG